jgi:hypothetical protein
LSNIDETSVYNSVSSIVANPPDTVEDPPDTGEDPPPPPPPPPIDNEDPVDRNQPPIALTSNNTIIDGKTYIVTAEPDWIDSPHRAFDKLSNTSFTLRNQWNFNVYEGPSHTRLVDGVSTVFAGPWLAIQFSYRFKVEGIAIAPNGSLNGPQQIRLLGSRDGTNWTMVFSRDETISYGVSSGGTYVPLELPFTQSAISYDYYLFTWLGNTSTTGTYLPRLAELYFITNF